MSPPRSMPPLLCRNGNNQLPDPNNPGSTLAPTYNARGDLTSDGAFNYSFDAQDHLVQAEAKGHSVNILYSYDASGRLIGRVRQTGWNGDTQSYADSTTQLFAYDGSELVAVTDGSGTVLQRFTWGPGVAGSIGGLLSITDLSDPANPQTYRVVPDASGNTAQLIDATGKVAGNFTYSAYGVVKSATDPAAGLVQLLYQQMYTDPDTGVVFFPARAYAPQIGKWIQRDPSGEGSDVDLTRYCNGDPINGRDPTGTVDLTPDEVIAAEKATSLARVPPKPTPATQPGIPPVSKQGQSARQAEPTAAQIIYALQLQKRADVAAAAIFRHVNNAQDEVWNIAIRNGRRLIPVAGPILSVADFRQSWMDLLAELKLARKLFDDRAAVEDFGKRVAELERAVCEAEAAERQSLRGLYTDEVAGLKQVGADLLRNGSNESEVAMKLCEMRRQIGIKYKEMTPPDLLEFIYKFNEDRYGGDKLGPTYDFFKNMGKTDAQIIAGASVPLGDSKQLGAALLDKFGEAVVPTLKKYDMLP